MNELIMEYTEHKKYDRFDQNQLQALFEFIEYMDANIEAQFVDESKPRIKGSEDILYDFLGIDKNKIELERKDMLKAKY